MKHILIIFLLAHTTVLWAQEDSEDAGKEEAKIDQIEDLFEEEEKVEARSEARLQDAPSQKTETPDKIEDLKILESFDDIAIIQRRYLPKSGRFEFFAAGGTNLNDAFFVGNGLQLRFGYYFTERWSVEALYSFFSNSDRDITKSLRDRGVDTQGQVATDSFYGVDLRWSPIYGKYGYFNEKIVPFDLYFSAGLGVTDPKIGNPPTTGPATPINDPGQPLTFRLGTGQIFALTKWMAFRWDLSWHFFNAQSPIEDSESLQNNLFLNMGVSFFFPEAKYR